MLSVCLFGRFSVHDDGRELDRLPGGKPLELFCYLLLQRERPHSREVLASLLWGDCTTSQSKKYLRQALWQLQEIVAGGPHLLPALLVDRESVRFNPQGDVWLDVAAFESACQQLQDVPRHEVTNARAEILKAAVELYRGDLLEGWYQEWCLFERERFQNLYLLILDKLMAYSEDQHQYEAGLEFGERILRIDRAHERTYQVMMRLQYLAGDRAGAVRLYQRCATALEEELGVKPGRHTMQTLDQIRGDLAPEAPAPAAVEMPAEQSSLVEARTIAAVLSRLRRVLSMLSEAQSHIQNEVQAVNQILQQKLPVVQKPRINK